MLTNLCWAPVQHSERRAVVGELDVGREADGEGARMYEACEALCDALTCDGHGGRRRATRCRWRLLMGAGWGL